MRFLRTSWSSEASGFMPESHRHAICGWLSAHNVDPNNVRAVEVRGRRIYVEEYERNDQGDHFVVDGEVATRSYSVRLRYQPPRLELL